MGIFDKAILISDIDGTLLYDGIIPQENLDAIEYFKKEGGLFTIATGRGVVAASEINSLVKCNLPAVVFQGGAVYDYESKQFLMKDLLDYGDKEIAIDIYKSLNRIGMQVHTEDCIYVLRENDGLWHHINYENLNYKIVTVDDIINLDWNKVVYFCDDEELYLSAIDYYKSLNYNNCVFLHTMTYFCNNGTVSKAFEYYPKRINKGNAVRFLAKQYNRIPFTIGDYFNDVELISASEYGAATLEAPKEIKALAKHITCGVKDGVVADYIGFIKTILRGS